MESTPSINKTPYQLIPLTEIFEENHRISTTAYLSIGDVRDTLERKREECRLPQTRHLGTRRIFQCCSLSLCCTATIGFLSTLGFVYYHFVNNSSDDSHDDSSSSSSSIPHELILGFVIVYGISTLLAGFCCFLSCINCKIRLPQRLTYPTQKPEIRRITRIIEKHGLLDTDQEIPCTPELISVCKNYLNSKEWKKLDFTQLKEISDEQYELFLYLTGEKLLTKNQIKIWNFYELLQRGRLSNEEIINMLWSSAIQNSFMHDPQYLNAFIQSIPAENLEYVLDELVNCIAEIPSYSLGLHLIKSELKEHITEVAQGKCRMENVFERRQSL